MIVYQLKCHRGHEFEAWFLNGSTYDSQQASGDVCCPVCGTTEVSKGMMAPNLSPNFSSGRLSSRKGGGRSAPGSLSAAGAAPRRVRHLAHVDHQVTDARLGAVEGNAGQDAIPG